MSGESYREVERSARTRARPICDETVMLITYPKMALVLGTTAAMVLQRIWFRQDAPGLSTIKAIEGRDFVSFPMEEMLDEMRTLKDRTIESALADLVRRG